jgi:hypothetical protein
MRSYYVTIEIAEDDTREASNIPDDFPVPPKKRAYILEKPHQRQTAHGACKLTGNTINPVFTCSSTKPDQ